MFVVIVEPFPSVCSGPHGCCVVRISDSGARGPGTEFGHSANGSVPAEFNRSSSELHRLCTLGLVVATAWSSRSGCIEESYCSNE